MTRRSLVRMLGLGAGVAIASPARADRIRILPEVSAGEAPSGGGSLGTDLRRFLEGVRVGERRAHGGLTVFWLHGPGGAAPFVIRTLDEARARGELHVTERDQATVSSLAIENRGSGHVLVLAGEILQGGKQNRIVLEDVLVPPRSGPLTPPVYCVAQGRWAGDANTDERRLRANVDDLLRSAAGADGSVRRGIGAGWLVEFRLSRSRGLALVAESQVVHAAIL